MVDVAVIGAGHNGLVAATVLARAGRSVLVLEAAEVLGGACRTEFPFPAAPRLGASTGAYLLGPFPPELLAALDLELPLRRRDPHYFLPLQDGRALLLGADAAANREAIAATFSPADADATRAMQAELQALVADIAPAWLEPPMTVVEAAERYVRPQLRQVFIDLVTGSVHDYLDRFGFASELLLAMFAVTDGFPGLHGGLHTPGGGFNLLVHNMCRLPGSDGTWMVVDGGMGTVTAALADAARRAGAAIRTNARVAAITTSAGAIDGIALSDGTTITAPVVVAACDPFTLGRLAGDGLLDQELVARIEEFATRPGTTLKLNVALAGLPRYRALPDPRGQHGATTHLLADQTNPLGWLERTHAEALAGQIPATPPIEVYTHTAVDPSLKDPEGRHSAALFVQWMPNRPNGASWDALADRTADQLIGVWAAFAPGVDDLVVDRQILHPEAIERRFGIAGGNIFHVDNSFAFDRRLPVRLADGLVGGGAGCHPAGSVIGAAGWIAAQAVLAG